jgi:two-component system response regulator MprA
MACVLLIDDDRALLRLLNRLFEFEGYEVLLAANGEQALETAARCSPDLIVLDLNMPEMSGEELHARLRNAGFRGIFLVVSATDRGARIAEQLGAWFVAKPFDPNYLLGVAASLLPPEVEPARIGPILTGEPDTQPAAA